MQLLDLAPEIIILIFEQLDDDSHRKSFIKNLSISRAWYRLALPVLIDNIDLSALLLSSRDLERFPPLGSALCNAIQAKTKGLSIRMIGHPSKEISIEPWFGNSVLNDPDEDDEDKADYDEEWEIWTTATAAGPGRCGSSMWRDGEHALLKWRKGINHHLLRLADILPGMTSLEELSLEVSSESDDRYGPRWDWLYGPTLETVFKSIPNSVQFLTLDTAGSTIVTSKECRKPMHMCLLIAKHLHQLQHVRLRMRHICPEILATGPDIGTVSQLESLVVRLSLPYYPPATYESHDGKSSFDSLRCSDSDSSSILYESMSKAGIAFAKMNPGMKNLKISYRPLTGSGISLALAECVRRVYMYVGAEVFCYEDEGRNWDGWEDDDGRLLISGSILL